MEFSKDKFIQIIENIKECYFEVDLKGIFTYFNESLCNVTGYSREELLGLNYKYITDEENRKKVFEGFNRVYNTGEPLTDFEYQFKRKAGEKIIGETSVYLKYDSNGDKIGFYGIFRDVTKRKEEQERFKRELEQLVNLKTQELRESEEKYRNLVENAHEGVWAVDENDDTIFVNPKICEMLGYTRDEIMGTSLHRFLEESMIDLILSYRDRREKGLKDTYELEFIKKDGTILNTIINAAPILNENREFKGSFAFINDITNRKIAEQKLKESEEKYRIISENANDLITISNTKMRLEYINEQVHNRVMGYTEDDLIGINGLGLIHPEDRDKVMQEFVKTFKTGNAFVEARIKHKDGHYVWTETSGSAIEDKNGVLKILLITRIIDERKKTEQQLKESEEKYRNMVNHLDLGFYQLTLDGLLINHNPRFCEILGYDLSENLKNRDVHDFWQKPENRKIYLKELEENGYVKNYLVQAKKQNGENIVVQLNSHLIRGNREKPKIIQGVISDITEKFELEQKIKKSEERYRNLIESVPFSIALIDRKGKIVYCNPPIEKLLGYRQDELVGIKFKDLPAIHPKYVPIVIKRFQRVLKGEILPPLEIELYKKDGSLLWIRYQSTLVKLGDQILLQAVINDISEEKKADLLIEEELIKLKELDQIRKDLISRVSHELKTPLVSVCGATELLLDSFLEEFKGDTKELLEIIEKGGKRLKHLVDNLVDITRIEYRKFELIKNVNDFSQVIRDCTNELMYLIKNRELNLELDLMDDLFIEFDKIRIEQVILNLLSNSIKNTPPNGKITVKSLKKDNHVELKITDTGIGLTKEEMDRLFARFGKIERYGDGLEYIDIQGTGLGLYISKEIIDLHEGQIWVESAGRDKGATFNIKIPI